MGIEDDFYATIKLKSGEEIFAKVAPSEEEDRTLLLVFNPITLTAIKTRMGIIGYRVEPWLKTTTEDLFILNLDDVLTMSESNDVDIISTYQSYIRHQENTNGNHHNINKQMGYLSNVNDAKEILEKIFKNI
jgi:hypothetical protein